jgi:hypothetical protein
MFTNSACFAYKRNDNWLLTANNSKRVEANEAARELKAFLLAD